MLDPKFIAENLDAVVKAAEQKNFAFDGKKFAETYERRSKTIEKTDELRRQRNAGSEAVRKAKDPAEREALLAEMRGVGDRLGSAEAELRVIESEFENLLLLAPSIPSADTPFGRTDADNVELRKVGTLPKLPANALDHIELGKHLGIVDFERGANIAGSRAYFLVGAGAALERALFNLSLDLLQARGYTQMSVPVIVRDAAMMGTGYLPLGADQAYHIEKDDLWLVGSSEVPLASYHAGEILSAEQLPVKLCAHSTCFRREAGAHGKDTKGLYRVHQFQKVEQVVLCEPDVAKSDALHAELLKNAEDLLSLLELPYRVVQVCTGDLGLGQVRKHDIETWMPSRNGYGETHSCSSFYDFQARRLKIRTKDAQGKTRPVFTLNNTALATPRLLIALMENHQTADRSIRIPAALRKYLGGLEEIRKP